MLTHLSLFTGIGGIDYAAEAAEFYTVGQCEMADYPYRVLCREWPDVPKWRDVKDVTADSFRESTGLRTVTLVSAGYPCQTFSNAGKRTGDLTLAREFIRVVGELRPKWALGENVAGHLTNGLADVIRLFQDEGYEARTIVLRASDAGAPHERKRVFILAHACNQPSLQKNSFDGTERDKWKTRNHVGCSYWSHIPEPDRTISKPELAGLANGVSAWMVKHKERTMTAGNAVVPWQVYPILKAIAEIEMNTVSE